MHFYSRTGVFITNFNKYGIIYLHLTSVRKFTEDSILLKCDTASMGNLVDKGTTLPQYVRIRLPIDTMSYPRKMESLATLLQKPQTLHRKFWNFIFQSHLGQAMILSIIIHQVFNFLGKTKIDG